MYVIGHLMVAFQCAVATNSQAALPWCACCPLQPPRGPDVSGSVAPEEACREGSSLFIEG